MQIAAQLGFLAFLTASLVIGVRLGLLARRTRELPETAMAVAFLCGGFLGYGSLVAVTVLGAAPPAWRHAIYLVSVVSMATAAAAVAVFTRRVFRPDARPAAVLVGAIGCALATGVVGSAALPPIEPGVRPTGAAAGLAFWGMTLGTGAAYLWAAAESGRYAGLLRRRRPLGLGDVRVESRLALWCVGEAAAGGISLLYAGARLLELDQRSAELSALSSLLVVASAAASWLAFFPPALYERWLVRQPSA